MAQSHAEARALVERVREAFDARTLKPPSQAIKDALAPLRRTFSLGPGAYPWHLENPTAVLCAYGHYRRVVAAARVLSEIDPLSWRLSYTPICRVIHIAYLFSTLEGDADAMRALEPSLFVPVPYAAAQHISMYSLADIVRDDIQIVANEPPPSFMNGEWLTLGFAHIDRVVEMYCSFMSLDDALALCAMGDLHHLATMYVFGGSRAWPRERICETVSQTISEWQRCEGWASGW